MTPFTVNSIVISTKQRLRTQTSCICTPFKRTFTRSQSARQAPRTMCHCRKNAGETHRHLMPEDALSTKDPAITPTHTVPEEEKALNQKLYPR
eukprot:6491322-Amphidinium_carterae.2